MKKNNSPIVNSRWKSFIKPIFTLLVIAVPSLMIWIFFSNDIFAKELGLDLVWWIKLLIAIGFICATLLITMLFVYLKILDMSIFMFSLPISICFMTIFVTDELVAWLRSIIVVVMFLLIIPISIYTKKIETKLLIRKKIKQEKNNEKIVGHKK